MFLTLKLILFQDRRSSGPQKFDTGGSRHDERSGNRSRNTALLRTPAVKSSSDSRRSPSPPFRGRKENFQISVRNESFKPRSKCKKIPQTLCLLVLTTRTDPNLVSKINLICKSYNLTIISPGPVQERNYRHDRSPPPRQERSPPRAKTRGYRGGSNYRGRGGGSRGSGRRSDECDRRQSGSGYRR